MEVMDYEDQTNEQVDVFEISSEQNTDDEDDSTEISKKECDSKNSKPAEESSAVDAVDSDGESDQCCPICMDVWTTSGDHRICCLRCGHLFGHSCILRWLKYSCNSTNRRCPQCNVKAAIKDIRMIYAKKLASVDTTELDELRNQLTSVTTEKKHLEMELSKCNLRLKMYEQQFQNMQEQLANLENRQSDIHNKLTQKASKHGKFHLERSFEICKDGGCRVIDYNPFYGILTVSQKSTNPLFNGYGITKIDLEAFQVRRFIFLHTQAIRDMKFHSVQQQMLLSVGFDKCAKLMDVQSNTIVHSFQTDLPLWSCCWSGENSNVFLAGAQNGSITQFDIRQTSGAVGIVENSGDRSPVVSLATVPPNPDNGISRGGFIACRLNTCYAYEQREGKYMPKQIFLEGPFVSVCYDEKNNHALVSCRPNSRQPNARHVVCTIEKGNDEAILCNVVHTFHAGNSQQLLSRPCHIHVESDTLVAAHQESTSTIPLWSISSGKQVHSLPVSDPVVDMCSFEYKNNLLLATLSAKKLRLYNYG